MTADAGSATPSGFVSRTRAASCVVGGVSALALVVVLAGRGFEPMASWLYPMAWYPVLLVLDGLLALRRRAFFLLGRSELMWALLVWSVPFWLSFELLNLRLQNWYYVFVPERRLEAWLGIVISFATVFPAMLLPAVLVDAWGGKASFDGLSAVSIGSREADPGGSPGGRPGAVTLRLIRWTGWAFLALPLVFPRWFFPLVWGAPALILEPSVLRRRPASSLLRDLVEGRWARTGALLLGGVLAGGIWESMNVVARGRWIYTVPGMELIKLFEIPPLGFLGFPALALSGWVTYQALVVAGLSPPVERPNSEEAWQGSRALSTRLFRGAVAAMVPLTLLAMEGQTISSRTPRLRDLPASLPSQVEDLMVWGVRTPFDLARSTPEALTAQVPGLSESDAATLVNSARLATFRGVGTRNAGLLWRWGITSVSELAAADPEALARCFAGTARNVRPAQVRVWVRAAIRAAGVRVRNSQPLDC